MKSDSSDLKVYEQTQHLVLGLNHLDLGLGIAAQIELSHAFLHNIRIGLSQTLCTAIETFKILIERLQGGRYGLNTHPLILAQSFGPEACKLFFQAAVAEATRESETSLNFA